MLTRICNWLRRVFGTEPLPDLERIFTLAPEEPVDHWECRAYGPGREIHTVDFRRRHQPLPERGQWVDMPLPGHGRRRYRITGVEARNMTTGGWDVEMTLRPVEGDE